MRGGGGGEGGGGVALNVTASQKVFYKDSYWFKGVGGGGDLIAGRLVFMRARVKYVRDGENGVGT